MIDGFSDSDRTITDRSVGMRPAGGLFFANSSIRLWIPCRDFFNNLTGDRGLRPDSRIISLL